MTATLICPYCNCVNEESKEVAYLIREKQDEPVFLKCASCGDEYKVIHGATFKRDTELFPLYRTSTCIPGKVTDYKTNKEYSYTLKMELAIRGEHTPADSEERRRFDRWLQSVFHALSSTAMAHLER